MKTGTLPASAVKEVPEHRLHTPSGRFLGALEISAVMIYHMQVIIKGNICYAFTSPMTHFSSIHTKLRDEYSTLDRLCEDLSISC